MSKKSNITYKLEPYNDLKSVSLHGQWVKPLYIRVTYKRKHTFFRSYYFDLFSKSKYFLSVAGIEKGPTFEQIVEMETQLIEFLIKKYSNNFSLLDFREKYNFYSTDLCDATEEEFVSYLFRFFQDEGVSAFAVALREGSRYRIAFDVVRDLKKILLKQKYDKLIENSVEHAPPYLLLYGFMLQTKKWPMLGLSVMEWEQESVRHSFMEYVLKKYPTIRPIDIVQQIDEFIKQLNNVTHGQTKTS